MRASPARTSSHNDAGRKLDLLVQQSDFQGFLSEALKIQYAKRGRVNLADFSKRSGFASRSYLSEILNQKKGLSRDSLLRIKSALKLPKPYLDVLELLGYKSNPAIRPESLSDPAVLEKELQSAMNAARAHAAKPLPSKQGSNLKLTRSSMLHRVYAGLGSITNGATLQEVVRRTDFSELSVKQSLKVLVSEGIVEERDERFRAISSQLDFFGLRGDAGLSNLVGDVATDIRMRRNKMIEDPMHMVFYTAFSTKKDKLPQLREQIKQAIFDVLDQFQVDDGDCVRQIFLSLSD